MIEYTEDWIFSLVFKLEGSVSGRACYFALPSAVTAVLFLLAEDFLHPTWREDSGLLEMAGSTVWWVCNSILVSLLFFRANAALRRFWEGTSLLHQMRGEWFDAVSCCITFSRSAAMSGRRADVMVFRHTLVRLMSLCHGSALEEIKADDESDSIETIDVVGLDFDTLKILTECKDAYNFNRVEMILHLTQSLITAAHDDGVLKIAPLILSRVYQTLSRGFVNLLNAKKITDTKFPFPFAQLISWLLLMQLVLTPMLITVVFKNKVCAFVFTFLPVFGSNCVNFISNELENPFGNDANDLPLDHFQAEMNNCLLMLLQPDADHVPRVSEDCCMDFTVLSSIASAARLSLCAQSKELSSITLSNYASPTKTRSSTNSQGRGKLQRAATGEVVDKAHSRGRVARTSIRGLVQALETGEGRGRLCTAGDSREGEIFPSSLPSPRSGSPRTTTRLTGTGMQASPSECAVIIEEGQSTLDCEALGEKKADERSRRCSLTSNQSRMSAQTGVSAIPSVSPRIPPGVQVAKQIDPHGYYYKEPKMGQDAHVECHKADLFGLQPSLLESMERFTRSLEDWSQKVEDQMDVVNRNTTVLERFCHSVPRMLDSLQPRATCSLSGDVPRGAITSQPAATEQDQYPPSDLAARRPPTAT